ncbi:MAG TPA: flippase [Candidatus Nanoarchaeia archaeon]|nr:flippase [Candidatus Nanoarchaeia archaeon]
MTESVSRGTAYLFLAQFVFLVSGYIVHVGLGRLLGPAEYGVIGIILSLMLLTQTLLMRGLPQALAKEISAHPEQKEALFNTAFWVQLLTAAVVTAAFFFGANLIAHFFRDPSLVKYIRLSSAIIIPTALFSLYSDGFLNGTHKFRTQAWLRGLNSILKPIFIFPLVLLGYTISGAVAGYILTGFTSWFFSWYATGIRITQKAFHSSLDLLKKAFPIMMISFTYVLLNNIDLYLLKHLLESNYAAGIFSAADNLARTSPQLFFALAFTIMPAISAALAKQELLLAKKYITEALRYLLLILLPITVMVSATATPLVTLFYSSSFADSGAVLQILIFGSMFFAMFTVLNSVAIGAGDSSKALWSSVLLIVVSTILNLILIPKYGVQGAAIATAATALLGVLIILLYVRIKFKAGFQWGSSLKIIAASLVIYLLARSIPVSGLWLALEYCLLGIIYLLLLLILGEIQEKDYQLVKKIFTKSKAK